LRASPGHARLAPACDLAFAARPMRDARPAASEKLWQSAISRSPVNSLAHGGSRCRSRRLLLPPPESWWWEAVPRRGHRTSPLSRRHCGGRKSRGARRVGIHVGVLGRLSRLPSNRL
jgi:hypothetical protein